MKRDGNYLILMSRVFASLSITGLLSAIEATVISTALPTISERLSIGEDYAWLVNSYFLTR